MKKLLFTAAALLMLCATACTDKESEIGLGLTDPSTLYNGKLDTICANAAYSLRDDSLMTTNYSYGIIGNYNDPLFGRVSSTLYSQIGLASGMSSINFDEVTIDSVVLSLVSDGLFPDTSLTYSFHFEVMQLDEPLLSDSVYYSFDTLRVNPSAIFYNQSINVRNTDTVVRLVLNPTINSILSQSGQSEDFLENTKGLRIRIVPDGDDGMLGINFAASATCLTAHYHYGSDTTSYYYEFLVGAGVSHFTHFTHDYSGTIFDGVDSIDGSQRLYLEPLAGFNARLDFTTQIQAFRAAHPYAVVHHAELLLPTTTDAPANKPDQIMVLTLGDNGVQTYIPDYVDAYTYRGFDGTYDNDRGLFRVRVTQYLQQMLRRGYDTGTTVLLDARRSSALRTILCGPQSSNPLKIAFVYTE